MIFGNKTKKLERKRAQAEKLVEKGDLEGAIHLYKSIGDPLVLGELYHRAGRYMEAVREYSKLDRHDLMAPIYEEAGLNKEAANCYERTGNYQRAFGLLKESGEIELAAEVARKHGDPLRAAELYEKAEEHAKAAELYLEGREPDKAIELYEKGKKWEELAQLLKERGDYVRAGRHFEELGNLEEALGCYQKGGRFLDAGRLFQQLGRPHDAARMHEKQGNLKTAGRILVEAGDKPHAIELLLKCRKRGDNDNSTDFILAELLLEARRYDEAIPIYQDLVQRSKFKAKSLMLLGDCFAGQRMFELALRQFQMCIEDGERVNDLNKNIFYRMAKSHERMGNTEMAKSIYREILTVDYAFEDARDRLDKIGGLFTVYTAPDSSHGAEDIPAAAPAEGEGEKAEKPAAPASQAAEQEVRYEILHKIGSGGMGDVFLAKDLRLGREVALKVLPDHLAEKTQLRERFIFEAQAAANLNHPNIITIYDVGQIGEKPFIAMEYVIGKTLRQLFGELEEGENIPMEYCLKIFIQVAEGLAAAHKRGVIHRDIKPDNIMIDDMGISKVMDFGIARLEDSGNLTDEGQVVGSARYMSPEQITGKDVDARTDIYALGITMYEALVGRPPFVEGDLAFHHVHTTPIEPIRIRRDIPPTLNQVILKCIAKARDSRYPSTKALVQTLTNLTLFA